MARAVPTLTDIHHSMCYSKDRYCGHPRQLPARNFGNGEIAVSHFHAPTEYRTHAWTGARRQGVHYRSPWPLRLHDGRIVVVFGRRNTPWPLGRRTTYFSGQ